MISRVLLWSYGSGEVFLRPEIYSYVAAEFPLFIPMIWSCIGYLQLFTWIYFSTLLLHWLSSLMGAGLYVLSPQFMFLYMIAHSWLHIPELYIARGVVTLGIAMPWFLVTSLPWSLIAMWPLHLGLWTQFLCLYLVLHQTGFVWRTLCTFQCYLFFAYVGLRWSSHETLSARYSGVPQGPCFRFRFLFFFILNFWHTRDYQLGLLL